MNQPNPSSKNNSSLKFSSILRARCPACHIGKVIRGIFGIEPKCSHCGYNFYPESGFYLGAIALSFLITAVLTIPPMIFLKLMNADMKILLGFPFVEFIFLGSILMIYSKVFWLHLEYRITQKIEEKR